MAGTRIDHALPQIIAHPDLAHIWVASSLAVSSTAASAAARSVKAVQAHGWQVAIALPRPEGGSRAAQAEVADALGLREPAERNLDALADQLLDLPESWPGCRALALIVTIDKLDNPGLLRVLSDRSERLLRLDGFQLETVLLTNGTTA
ncbi:hypothetical protein K0651_06970 [Ornithinimicrobium sp. Arc0846-15]|nr:hypothetical protein [Ornithinimicrobium laminariae]